jgi:hypothetical protein
MLPHTTILKAVVIILLLKKLIENYGCPSHRSLKENKDLGVTKYSLWKIG